MSCSSIDTRDVENLSLKPRAVLAEPEAEEEQSTLIERLLETAADHESLSNHIAQRLTSNAVPEAMLFLDRANLYKRDWSFLFQPPEDLEAEESQSSSEQSQSWPLSKSEMAIVIESIKTAAAGVGASMGVLWDPSVQSLAQADEERNDQVMEQQYQSSGCRLLLRQTPDGPSSISEVRVAVCGNVDSGKSTLTSVLANGRLDDGRGRARMTLFRHKHEQETGRTSSIGLELLGFDAESKGVVGQTTGSAAETGIRKQQASWDAIARKSAKIISFIDLCGHERYFKTTLSGMTGSSPDYAFLVIGSNAGIIGMSKEHVSVALALNIPLICILTKIDMTPTNVQASTRKHLLKILRSPGCRKEPIFVRDGSMAVELGRNLGKTGSKTALIFETSNVTGEGIDLLRSFLNVLRSSEESGRFDSSKPFELSISEVFSVPFVGAVVSGVIISGQINVGDIVLLGPDSLGQFTPTSIRSIQRKRVDVRDAHAGQSISCALKRIKRNQIRKGQLLTAGNLPAPRAVWRFEASILVLYHNTTIQAKYQSMVHVSNVRQTVRICEIREKDILRTGDRATVVMEFIRAPEAVKPGQKILFREGKCKGLGMITTIL